jgi:hypothetical protein
MNEKPRCEICKHWTETKIELRIGKCSILNMLTEWSAGTVYSTPFKTKFCEHFKEKENYEQCR